MRVVTASLSTADLRALTDEAAHEGVVIDDLAMGRIIDEHRATSGVVRRRVDAWTIEQAGAPPTAFVWSVRRTRRTLGNAAARLVATGHERTVAAAVRVEMDRHLNLVARGWASRGTLSWWIAEQSLVTQGIIAAEAVAWGSDICDIVERSHATTSPLSDIYLDLPTCRTSWRARRDLLTDDGSIIVRVRGGAPSPTSGAGLRADLAIATVAAQGQPGPARIVGLWPHAGVALAIDSDELTVHEGLRDLAAAARTLAQHEASQGVGERQLA
jgi:hypothetical protein